MHRLNAFAERKGLQPIHQDDLDQGKTTFAELWQENLIHLERMVADVWDLLKKFGVAV
ncbi:MAG: hypothetical protein MH252_12365 [Thermosynechococcaceae cyanobacterium MS004]|nr:hypothetical protein [Thermosynechococcaceae cyanobacterium MS004]